jgi:cobyrinic acid a,c-diamide synthase
MSPPVIKSQGRTIRIGVAQDQAFCFYYPDNLELLEAAGAEIITFSPLHDDALPDVEMLYLGGGYPELHGAALAENVAMRAAVKRFAERGGVIYAECGGLMYLMESIRDFDGCSHDMVGIFPAQTAMQKPGLTLGYRTVECSRRSILGDVGATARGHEFHYSTLVSRGPLPYACALRDAAGLSKGQDGIMSGKVLALYTHLHVVQLVTYPHRLGECWEQSDERAGSEDLRALWAQLQVWRIPVLVWQARHYRDTDGLDRSAI